jgi:catechol 2,3-dioxygenase-like lactoylglutathione lyase family enzyme
MLRLSHIGICVSDLDASIRFYAEGLGFSERHRLLVTGAEAEQLLELEKLELEAVYLERDGTRIELLHYRSPGHVGEPVPRPINRLGLTHLSMRVSDLDAAIRNLVSLGATLIEGTQMYNPAYEAGAVFLADPDGVRIELVQSPTDPDSLPGE